MPGCQIGKQGLPGGKLECKKDKAPLEIKEKYLDIIEQNIPFMTAAGKIKTGSELARLEKEADNKAEEAEENADADKLMEDERKKAQTEQKLNALIAECGELEIDVPENPTQKALKELIEAKKKELESGPDGGDA